MNFESYWTFKLVWIWTMCWQRSQADPIFFPWIFLTPPPAHFNEGYTCLLALWAKSLTPAVNWVESPIRWRLQLPAYTGGGTSEGLLKDGGALAEACPEAFWEATVPLLITRVTRGYQAILSLERHSASLNTYTQPSSHKHTHTYLTVQSAPKRGAHALTPFMEYEI